MTDAGGKPGAVVSIPPGDYRLRTQVVIDISFLRIEGYGHGFTSVHYPFQRSRRRVARPARALAGRQPHPGRPPVTPGADESAGAAFYIERTRSPRIGSVEFSNFCIDGLHFEADGSELHPRNTYVNGKTGIYVAGANDSFRVNGMGLSISSTLSPSTTRTPSPFTTTSLPRCGSCIELRRMGTASKVTDNLIGAGFRGALDLRREPRRAPDHREQRLPPRCEQRAFPGRHPVQRDQQPPALVLPRHGEFSKRTVPRTWSPRIISCATTSPGPLFWRSTTGSMTCTDFSVSAEATTPSSATTSRRSSTRRASVRRCDPRHHPAHRGGRQLRRHQPCGGDGCACEVERLGFAAQVDALFAIGASEGLAVTAVMVDPQELGPEYRPRFRDRRADGHGAGCRRVPGYARHRLCRMVTGSSDVATALDYDKDPNDAARLLPSPSEARSET